MATSHDMPTYNYRPPNTGGRAYMRSRSNLRARLTNDTFFRSKEAGSSSNNITISASSTGLRVRNLNTKVSENVIVVKGRSIPNFTIFELGDLPSDGVIVMEVLSPSSAKISYSISLKIRKETTVKLGQACTIPGVLTLGLSTTPLNVGDVFEIRPRVQVFPLEWITITETDPDTNQQTSYSGWNITKLREMVNNTPQVWIEMPTRGYDAQDIGEDGKVLKDFPETHLMGGDGLPERPDGEFTGMVRSIIHINYAEDDSGRMRDVNTVYEWQGESANSGQWVKYN